MGIQNGFGFTKKRFDYTSTRNRWTLQTINPLPPPSPPLYISVTSSLCQLSSALHSHFCVCVWRFFYFSWWVWSRRFFLETVDGGKGYRQLGTFAITWKCARFGPKPNSNVFSYMRSVEFFVLWFAIRIVLDLFVSWYEF